MELFEVFKGTMCFKHIGKSSDQINRKLERSVKVVRIILPALVREALEEDFVVVVVDVQ